MEGPERDRSRRAELYVRSLRPEGLTTHQETVFYRLASLTDRGRLMDWNVRVWGKQAPATVDETRTRAGADTLERVDRFREWAAHNGRSLAKTFDIRTVDSSITDEQYRALVFPTHLLVEYEADQVTCVTPHADGTDVVTVADRLAALEADEATTFGPVTDPSAHSPARIEPLTDVDREPLAPD
jgi:hypothetical protein